MQTDIRETTTTAELEEYLNSVTEWSQFREPRFNPNSDQTLDYETAALEHAIPIFEALHRLAASPEKTLRNPDRTKPLASHGATLANSLAQFGTLCYTLHHLEELATPNLDTDYHRHQAVNAGSELLRDTGLPGLPDRTLLQRAGGAGSRGKAHHARAPATHCAHNRRDLQKLRQHARDRRRRECLCVNQTRARTMNRPGSVGSPAFIRRLQPYDSSSPVFPGGSSDSPGPLGSPSASSSSTLAGERRGHSPIGRNSCLVAASLTPSTRESSSVTPT